MRRLVLLITFVSVTLLPGIAQYRVKTTNGRSVAVAFFDEDRLGDREGQTWIQDFEFFNKGIQQIIKREFPDVEFRILGRGELLRLPDGTGVNVQNLQPKLGYILSTRGRKRRLLSGVQSDTDFACAAAAFFRRSSSACPK